MRKNIIKGDLHLLHIFSDRNVCDSFSSRHHAFTHQVFLPFLSWKHISNALSIGIFISNCSHSYTLSHTGYFQYIVLQFPILIYSHCPLVHQSEPQQKTGGIFKPCDLRRLMMRIFAKA